MHTGSQDPSVIHAEPLPEPREPCELTRGAVVGRFLVLETLGAGGMGVVYAAYDPELDRKVALKLLSPGVGGADSGSQTRLVREAQALAKLSHPNVVAVHDVGMHGEGVWIAMEFVAGQTLTAWAKERPRRWSEVLALLADVARGVAAAHGTGLVHRDLKPDNVMLGRDGRVRVMDFGLAHGRSVTMTESELATTLVSGANAPPDLGVLALRLTAAGAVQGTPAYMAPEQWEGQEAQTVTDQFGWSVMAWELLYGERPFAGETRMALAAAVVSGQRRSPPRGRGVPGWLRRVVERGLAIDPARRWPTMAALLSALERGKTRARLRMGAVALASVAWLGAGAEGYRRWDIAQRVNVCEMSGAEIDKVWNDDARQQLREAFAATGASYAATSAEKVMPWLDKQAVAWKEARTEVCLNGNVRETWDADLVDRALWCLEDRQIEIESLVGEFGRANKTVVQKAVSAVTSLRMVDDCLDESRLRLQPVAPMEGRAAIRDVRAMLSRAQSLGLAGDLKGALTVATQAHEQAAILAWTPLLATVRAREGSLLEKSGAYEAAEAASAEAYFAAASSGAWDVAARAASNLIFTVGVSRAQHEEGHMWARHAEMALTHTRDTFGLLEAQRLNNLAVVYHETGSFVEARRLHDRALAIREQALGPSHPDVAASLHNLAMMYKATGGYAEAIALYERALAIREQALGLEHPDVAASLNNLANVYKARGAYAKARTLLERALAIREQSLGLDHAEVAASLNNLADVYISTLAYAEARTFLERALAIKMQRLGPDHPDVAASLSNLAMVYQATGEHTEARKLCERALSIQILALGPGHSDVALSLNILAGVHLSMGAHTEARVLYERAMAIREQALGPVHPDVAISLYSIAEMNLVEKKPQDALPLLERAVAIYDRHAGVQVGEIEAHFSLARALIATGGARTRALIEATKARDGLREAGVGKTKELAEVEQWLAENEGNP
jgi:tetratricopeptide (TPR) repeat protein